MEDSVFLPCPSCGEQSFVRLIQIKDLVDRSEAKDLQQYDSIAYDYIAICSATTGGCGFAGPPAKTKRKATLSWNTRKNIKKIRISDV